MRGYINYINMQRIKSLYSQDSIKYNKLKTMKGNYSNRLIYQVYSILLQDLVSF